MSGNDTSVVNSTYTNSSSPDDIRSLTAVRYVSIAVAALSTITFIIGISSWILIKKFRHFRNFLFLNIILNNVLVIVLELLAKDVKKSESVATHYAHGLMFLFFKMSIHCWLLVLCYLFYIELVKVFDGDVKKKYLKSTLFVWGLSLIITVFDVFIMPHVTSAKISAICYLSLLFLPLVINLLIYIRVLYALLKIDFRDSNDRFKRFGVATMIFLISGALFLVLMLRLKVNFPLYLSMVLVYLQPLAMDLYFFAIRLNRTVWRTYYEKKIKSSFIPLNLKK